MHQKHWTALKYYNVFCCKMKFDVFTNQMFTSLERERIVQISTHSVQFYTQYATSAHNM